MSSSTKDMNLHAKGMTSQQSAYFYASEYGPKNNSIENDGNVKHRDARSQLSDRQTGMEGNLSLLVPRNRVRHNLQLEDNVRETSDGTDFTAPSVIFHRKIHF